MWRLSTVTALIRCPYIYPGHLFCCYLQLAIVCQNSCSRFYMEAIAMLGYKKKECLKTKVDMSQSTTWRYLWNVSKQLVSRWQLYCNWKYFTSISTMIWRKSFENEWFCTICCFFWHEAAFHVGLSKSPYDLCWHPHRETIREQEIRRVAVQTQQYSQIKEIAYRLRIFPCVVLTTTTAKVSLYTVDFPFSNLKSNGCLSPPHKALSLCSQQGEGLICVVQSLPLTERCLNPPHPHPLCLSWFPHCLSVTHMHLHMHMHRHSHPLLCEYTARLINLKQRWGKELGVREKRPASLK